VTVSDALGAFTPAVRDWFESAFAGPTPVQVEAWAAIDSGDNALVIAPTGSGKTLAAFMHAIDGLHRERAAAPVIGVCGYGVHLNGTTMRDGVPHMWIARRAATKSVEPGKLDQVAAGGIPYGIGVFENLIKESDEEAAIPAALARTAKPVGIISYTAQVENGIRADTLYNYDLELPPDFRPHNRDGEVDAFHCLPLDEVARLVRDSDEFKQNSAVVVIDYLIRHGYLTPDDTPDYPALCRGIHRRHPQMQS